MNKASKSTHDLARGLVRGRGLGTASVPESESSGRDTLPLLDAPSSGSMEVALFFHLGGGFSSSSSSSLSFSSCPSLEKGALVPPDAAPEVSS